MKIAREELPEGSSPVVLLSQACAVILMNALFILLVSTQAGALTLPLSSA